jgi:signal transduction histidine kinase
MKCNQRLPGWAAPPLAPRERERIAAREETQGVHGWPQPPLPSEEPRRRDWRAVRPSVGARGGAMNKVMSGVLALGALVVLLGGSALLLLHWMTTTKDQVFHEQVQELIQAQELATLNQRSAHVLRSYLLTGRPELREENDRLRVRFQELLELSARQPDKPPEALALLHEIQRISSRLDEISLQLADQRERGVPLEQIGESLAVHILPTRALLDETLARLVALEQRHLEEAQANTVQSASLALRLTGGLVLGAVVLAALLVWTVRREEQAVHRASAFERQLVGIVTHDLRSPLTSILLATRALSLKEEARPFASTLERIERSAGRIESITQLLLDFTRARLGAGIPVVAEPMDLQALCHEVAEETRTGVPERALQEEYEGDLRGQWDAARLAQVLSNLLQNALKYSPPGTPVRLRATALDGSVRVEVHNLGEPIPRELLPRLFEPFQSGARTSKELKTSLGLGLYIVREVVRAHGGSLAVRSEPAEGTTFTLTLPRGRRR